MGEFRSPVMGEKIHYVSAFLPSDGSERKCMEAEVAYVHPSPDISVDICISGIDENGNPFQMTWVMFRGLSYGYWFDEKVKGFQPHSWHYPENDEIREKDA